LLPPLHHPDGPPLQIIRRPVDIAKIQQRIDDEKYDDFSAMQKVGAVKSELRFPL